jgi:hypothetical protein
MTQLDTRPPGPPPHPPEDLIEEARRRHRHRLRVMTASLTLFALLAAATAFGIAGLGGGGGRSSGGHALAPAAGSKGNGPHSKHGGPKAAHPPAASSPASPPPSAAPTAPTPAVANAALPSTTAVQSYSPWAGPGALSPQFHVIGQLSGGSCVTNLGYVNVYGQSTVIDASNADPTNAHAFRCSTDEGTYDPCFAAPAATNITQLACASTPYLNFDVSLLTLSQPLASSSNGFTPTGTWPLVLVLANGDQCQVIQGTGNVVDQVALNYGCSSGDATYPDTRSSQWTVSYLPSGATTLVTVAVTTAWE